ncbi:MAG: hypothetical protein JRH20_01375 [Deltaproteobacteria bacterium]|nr:hypothetical protein [Deltaproteobacteria bacterium]
MIASRWLTLTLALGTLLGSVEVAAQSPDGKAPRKYPNLMAQGTSYSGVTLRGGEPPKAKAPPHAGLQYVTWPGFSVDPERGTEVFVQLTGPVPFKVRQKGRRVSITVKKVQVYLRNNLRAINTQHFPGPVARFRLRRLGRKAARLEILLKRKVTPRVDLRSQGAYHYLVVSFPAE